MLLGVTWSSRKSALPVGAKLTRLKGAPATPGRVAGIGSRYAFDYAGADTAIASTGS